MSLGAVVGIVVGIAVLFLAGAALFILYWRRQRRFREEDLIRQGQYANYNHSSTFTVAPYYTRDYKKDGSDDCGYRPANYGDYDINGSAEITSLPPSYATEYQLANDSVSALPIHPAYIPRAMMPRRGTPAQSRIQSSIEAVALQAPPPACRSKTRPDDYTVQAYLQAADRIALPSRKEPVATSPVVSPQDALSAVTEILDDGEAISPQSTKKSTLKSAPALTASPVRIRQRPVPQEISLASLPSSVPQKVPSLVIPSATKLRQPKVCPRLRTDFGGDRPIEGRENKPIEGRENMEISGPLAFPEQQFRDGSASSTDRRTPRDRSNSTHDSKGRGLSISPQSAGDRIIEQTVPKRRWEEVPLGSGKSELYG
jgi:hypothetical protein